MSGRVVPILALLLLAHAFEIPVTMTEQEREDFLYSHADNLKGAVFYRDKIFGFSVILTKDVKKGDCVVALSPQNAITGAEPFALTPFLTGFSSVEMIGIRAAYERLMPRDTSNYKREYIHSLPAGGFDLPLFWSDEDFELFEKHTIDFLPRQMLRVHDIDALHKRIVDALEDVPNLPPGMLTKEATLYGLAIAMTRAFGSGGETMKEAFGNKHIKDEYQMLLPLMDIVNHYPVPPHARDGSTTIFQVYFQLEPWICYRAQFDHKAGHHFMGTYGQKPNYKLVDTYSFAMEKNPDDEISFYLPMTDYCKGVNRNNQCVYTSPAYVLNTEALKHLLKSVADVSVRGERNYEALLKMIEVAVPAQKNKMIFALRTYRNHLLGQMVSTPLRELRRIRASCSSYRCYMINVFCAAQRVSRLLHTEMVDRRLMKLLSAGIL